MSKKLKCEHVLYSSLHFDQQNCIHAGLMKEERKEHIHIYCANCLFEKIVLGNNEIQADEIIEQIYEEETK